jgi:hypothetical protein
MQEQAVDSFSPPPQQQRGCFCSPCIDYEPRARTIRWWLLGGSALSMILAYVSVRGCSFIKMDFDGDNSNLFDPYVLGLFNMAIYDEDGDIYGCVPQNGDERFKDAAFGAGRTFGVLTAIFSTTNFLLAVWTLLVMRPDWADRAWRCLQALCATALFCQLTTFAPFGSSVCTQVDVETFGTVVTIETECGPGAASGFAAVNVILLMAMVALTCVVPAPIHPHFIRWKDDDDADASFDDGDDRSYSDKHATDDELLFDDGGNALPVIVEESVDLPDGTLIISRHQID